MSCSKKLFGLMMAVAAIAANAQLLPLRPLSQRNAVSHPTRAAEGPQAIGSNPFLLIDYPGGIANQYPTGINDKGRIVGIVGLPDGSFHGYLLQGTTFKDINFPGSPSSGAFGINQSGMIVGVYCDDAACDSSHGFSLKGKNFTSIDYPGGINAEAMGVNASGDIVGVYQGSDLFTHGFLLHKGVFATIDPAGSRQTVPFSINKQGTIVGGFIDSDGIGHGFILQNGTFTQVDYPGAGSSELEGINDAGDMVGSFSDPGVSDSHGFLLSGGVFTPFDVPFPGQISTGPSGLNNKHQVVGSYGSYPPDYFFGFLTTY